MINLQNFEGNSPFEVYFSLIKAEKTMTLKYRILGNIDSLLLESDVPAPHREIGLWERTCFEFFIKNNARDDYFEFNFGSNKNWNMFMFKELRGELTEHLTKISPLITSTGTGEEYNFKVEIPLEIFPLHFLRKNHMSYSPTTIIETKDHQKFHYASSHPDNKLDFHRYESFDQSL